MRMVPLWIALAICLAVTTGCSGPAPVEKKSYTFHGKVEAVDKKAKSLTVDGENVEGWMGAMTMDYKVDDPAVLKKVKPGDRIAATVYDGDYTLHKVQVVPKAADSTPKK